MVADRAVTTYVRLTVAQTVANAVLNAVALVVFKLGVEGMVIASIITKLVFGAIACWWTVKRSGFGWWPEGAARECGASVCRTRWPPAPRSYWPMATGSC